jgi:LAO/AO transport system kinase
MQDIPQDKGVYIRSMGSRGSSGGLAESTTNVSVALDAFGFDTLVIETVGVGQMELDIIDACDTVVVTLVPESGDAIQALKAGLMEIADVFAVNKADRPGADQMAFDLQSALEMRVERTEWETPIVSTEAINNKGIDTLMTNVTKHRNFLETSGQLTHKRGSQIKKRVEEVIERLIQRDLYDKVVTDKILEEIAQKVLKGEEDPYTAGRALYARFRN